MALQSAEAARLLPGMTAEGRLASAHVAPAGAPPRSGGAAFEMVLAELPGGAPLASLSRRLPGLIDSGYRLVAANRGRLSRLVPHALSRRADALVRERSRPSPSERASGAP